MHSAANRTRWIRLISAFFLVVLLAEFASHGTICAVVDHDEPPAISASDRNGEDPCRTLVLCSNTREKERQTASFAHDKVPHNGLFGSYQLPLAKASQTGSTVFLFPGASARFRPPDLLFRPPKLT